MTARETLLAAADRIVDRGWWNGEGGPGSESREFGSTYAARVRTRRAGIYQDVNRLEQTRFEL